MSCFSKEWSNIYIVSILFFEYNNKRRDIVLCAARQQMVIASEHRERGNLG